MLFSPLRLFSVFSFFFFVIIPGFYICNCRVSKFVAIKIIIIKNIYIIDMLREARELFLEIRKRLLDNIGNNNNYRLDLMRANDFYC